MFNAYGMDNGHKICIWFNENDEIKSNVLFLYINPWMNIPVLNSASKNAKQFTKFMSNILLDDN